MFLAPQRQYGDHAQAHREEAGGEEAEYEEGGEEDICDTVFGSEEDFGQKILSEEIGDEASVGEADFCKEVVRSCSEALGRVQPQA